jgi:hypothetical protein
MSKITVADVWQRVGDEGITEPSGLGSLSEEAL